MTHKLHINAHFIVFFAFFRQIQQIFLLSLLHLKTFLVAHPGTRTWCHAVPWWALCYRYPRGPQQQITNTKYFK